MKKLLLGLLVSVILLSTMVGCASSKEVNGKQIEVVMEKENWTQDDGDKIENYLNQQVSREANYSYSVSKVYEMNNIKYDNLFEISVKTKLTTSDYGHNKETVEFVNEFESVLKELEVTYNGAEFDINIQDVFGNYIAYYDTTENKMVLCFE